MSAPGNHSELRSDKLPSEAIPVIGQAERCMHGKPMGHDCAEYEERKRAERGAPPL